ncbi:MAG: class I SAM-dependent methyltransferase [Acidobacteriota bacterium]
MTEYYKEDLAFIHDAGFSEWALKSALGLLDILKRNGIRDGLVVDLGCGSGVWAHALSKAGFEVLGIDISESMIDIARKKVPAAEFRVASIYDIRIPPCKAVTSISECLNYVFGSGHDGKMRQLFDRVYDALTPGGVFVFDVVEPGQVKSETRTKGFTEGDGWVVLVEKEEDSGRCVLTRRITSFRKVGSQYRRSDEVHRQRLFKSADIARELRRAGFKVITRRGYGRYRLPPAHAVLIARKPVRR